MPVFVARWGSVVKMVGKDTDDILDNDASSTDMPSEECAQSAESNEVDDAHTKNSSVETRLRRSAKIRGAVVAALFVLVGIGLAFDTGFGTISAMGYGAISAVCPLGALESFIASKTMVPYALVAFAVFIVLALLFGRAFCGWVCPVSLLAKALDRSDGAGESEKVFIEERTAQKRHKVKLDSRHWILGGALVSSAIVGFPVFCLVCPVGLVFATFIALWRAFQFAEPTIGLIVFPLIIVLELTVLKKWCHRFCPISALISLVSSFGSKTFVPKVDFQECRLEKGMSCNACVAACPEHIDPHDGLDAANLPECTRCKKCADVCPAHAITLPFKQ